jgi:succinoglycan biosynthesis transport protein ExoP
VSKYFELMQALREAQRDSSPSRESAKIVPPGQTDRNTHSGSPNIDRVAQLDFDRVAQEECLKLVQNIFLGQSANPVRAIVFAGIDRGNGCSRICVEAARTLAANTSSSVCLVDANFRTPSLPRFLRVPDDRGLADSLTGEGGIRSFAKQLKPSNLWLLSGGTLAPESPSLLNSDRLKQRFQELREEFNYILIDAPALNLYTDAIALGRVTDGVVVVLQADSTRRETARKGLESLRQAHIEVIGAVLNRRTFPIPDFVYRRL